jgi:putative copper resistance protein D
MGQLLDVFGFLSVLLRGFALSLNSLVLGGVVFSYWVLRSSSALLENEVAWRHCRRLLCWSAGALAVVQVCIVANESAVLCGTAGMSLRQVAGASFFMTNLAGAAAAIAVAAATVTRTRRLDRWLWLPAILTLASLVGTSHAVGRLTGRGLLLLLTTVHHASTAAWIGGIPYLILSMTQFPPAASLVCHRFSRLAILGLCGIAASGIGMSMAYVGAPDAVYSTSYGAMVATKVVFLVLLLVLGGFNFLIVRQRTDKLLSLLGNLHRFAEAEIGIGFTVIFAAASLTSQPPSIDLIQGRVSQAEIRERMHPAWPSMQTPPVTALTPATPLAFGSSAGPTSFVPGTSYHPSSPADIAWSEYNHHWAGLIVLASGLLAALAGSGLASWARHWPLAFLGLAIFLFLRADPENWPLGPRSFWQSFAVAEVLQHRLFVLLIVAFAVFEWGVRNGRISSFRASLVFPAVCAAGGALLLTHTHSLGNVKEELLAELSHIPLAVIAVIAGWSRWLEIRLPSPHQRVPAYIWPVCLIFIGAVLLNYREH